MNTHHPNTSARRLQFSHFFNEQRTWFDIQMVPPDQTPEGWVNDGRVRISIGEGPNQRGSFLLSIDEVCRLIMTLRIAVKEHEAAKTRLWRT